MKLFKKLALTSVIVFTATMLFAQDSNLNFKAGAQFPDAPNKAGFDAAISANYGADKYFTIGAEAGFGWVKYKDEGDSTKVDDVEFASVDKTNIYSFPLLAVATIRLADMKEQYGFMPYITAGAGWTWAKFDNPDLPDEFDETFNGFTWQAVGGVNILLGSDSNLTLILEGGWRSAELDNSDDIMLDMSGFICHAGISFPIGASDY
ncbi:MAG TPA: outer membrane beta-barrel protein [Spirochaetota bacterium]|nr:outer membrane beta-barrel protein [Spirochaetota bacterium]HPJ34506.1 outer membrane beta-barrel protein [Spirochaetota bacterium]